MGVLDKKRKIFNPLTAISGSGPAYIFFIYTNNYTICKKVGFSDKVAHQLTLQTLKGSLGILE